MAPPINLQPQTTVALSAPQRAAIMRAVTDRLVSRSAQTRALYLKKIDQQKQGRLRRLSLAPANQAHGYAALPGKDKIAIRSQPVPMLAIVSAYNDVLSAHQPLEHYPVIIRDEARKHAAVAQFAGGVPAMCDGVTQGQAGMELSLFSRDVIAMSTAIALSHDLYDGQILLGVCDKIVPGLLLGALSFGHLPAIFIPAGPMASGLSNTDKSKVRKQFAQGQVDSEALLEAEMAAYHDKGTCTFYGTANSNQLLLEAMGLMLPGAAFVQPDDPHREYLTRAATAQLAQLAHKKQALLGELVNEKVIVNAIVALLATGGSTNHTIHWVAIARAAGILLSWEDIHALATAVPTLTRIYPSGTADINQFDQAGGIAAVVAQLLDAGLLHNDVQTVIGHGLDAYTKRIIATRTESSPTGSNSALRYASDSAQSSDDSIISTVAQPFLPEGGLRMLEGNLGRAVVKISAVAPEHRSIKAQARVFESQAAVIAAFKANEFTQDTIVVVRGQGPKACGMPELHQLTPTLSVLLDRGLKVALVTDGRMSGASGKVPAAIHVCPEAADGGPIAKVLDGDWLEVDCDRSILRFCEETAHWQDRQPAPVLDQGSGTGRELFTNFRKLVTRADEGAVTFGA
jgi:phosphogluconate dehydratase